MSQPLTHHDYRFSITLFTDDRAVLNCLRALSQVSQLKGNVRIPWGGTKDDDWERDGREVTFRFTEPAFRLGFVRTCERVIKPGLWKEVRRSDADPASPQSNG